jgi:hypothetical protein
MSVCCCIKSNLSWSSDTDEVLSSWQIVNFQEYFLGTFYFWMCDVALEKRRFRSRIKVFGSESATLPWTAVLRIVINGTVSLIRKRKNILSWALIIGALCFSFTNFVISRLKGKIAVCIWATKLRRPGFASKWKIWSEFADKVPVPYATSDSLRENNRTYRY